MSAPTVEAVRETLAEVCDPEIPVLALEDLGVLRDVTVVGDDVIVTITPTYSGCPAMDEIRGDITAALARRGWERVTVQTVLAPAWTTDWMTERGRQQLLDYGLAPPQRRGSSGPVAVSIGRRPDLPACPHCGSARTEELSRFGSTSCKSLWRCTDCREPFDHFKSH